MSALLVSILAAFIALPLLGYVLVFAVSKSITGNHRQSVRHAVDFTAILLIISVHFIITTIWGKSFLWLILIILLASGMAFTVIHWKIKGEVVISKVFKGFWRFNFLLFLIGYISLILFGLIQRAAISVHVP